MPYQFEQGEVFLINKPYQWTSFDVVGSLRGFLRAKAGIHKIKIGHAGTLDPLATGLLILCTGKFTKQIESYQALEKEYTGTFTLGATTPSFDLETEIDQRFPTDHISKAMILDCACRLTGDFDQSPPVFSAKKIDGKRAYKYARKDIEVVMRPRRVNVSAFEITGIEMPRVHFRIACSKGTYIRSLASEFGKLSGSGAHLSALCRTRIGSYHLRDAFELEDLKKKILESMEDSTGRSDE
ncbi:MAG: tRNA pseudouridine(55) synthase TruB [bacterium]